MASSVYKISGRCRHRHAAAYQIDTKQIKCVAKLGKNRFEALEGDLKNWQDGGKLTEDQVKW